jgi:thiosulfate/3-mercaptopyruvate sulfurtransferase
MGDVTIDELVGRLGEVAILDVRTKHEYDGTGGQGCDPRQGHIPGARRLDIARMFELSSDELRAEIGLPAGAEVIVYCHSGGRSAMAAQVLSSVGFDARNYAGSWHEWSRRDDLAIETGAE